MRALILAAGKGTRMRSEQAKVLHELMGKPMLAYPLDILESLKASRMAVVAGAHAEQVRAFLKRRYQLAPRQCPEVILQREQKGTGHAVMMARKFFKQSSEDILIWPGDMPLLKRETIRAFIDEHRRSGAAVSVLSALVVNPAGYGRILRSGGRFFAIREELDATESERRIQEINTGVYLFQAKALADSLREIKPANAKNEYYLTDTIEVLVRAGAHLEAFPLAISGEGDGINSREQLASAMKVINRREVDQHMVQGVTIVNPDQTYIEPGVKIGQDTVIYPWTYIESGVKIGKNCQVGPFAKIRKGTSLGNGCVVGSFVELNRSKIGNKVSAKHLAYLGDAVVGDETNIGAGTITANYDGRNKHVSRLGKRVLVGSNTVFVAPVHVGDGARTGAGAVVTGGTKVKKGSIVVGVPARPIRGRKRG